MQKSTSEPASVQEIPTIRKRIRTTDYIVGIHFSATSKESSRDKVFRLIKNEITKKKTEQQ